MLPFQYCIVDPDVKLKAKKVVLYSCQLWILFASITCSGNLLAVTEPPINSVISATENLVNHLKTKGDAIRATPRLAFELVNKEIIPLIDFSSIAKSVLGRHWRNASQEQRQLFIKHYRTFVINLYTSAMVTYSKEIVTTADSFKFSTRSWQPANTKATVIMEFKLKRAAPIKVGYNMHWKENSWKIYDVHVLGMSVVAIYRNNFDSEINRYGLNGLLERLAAKNKTGTYSDFIKNTNSLKPGQTN